MRTSTLGKFGAVLQIAVLLLVQFSAVAPGLARALHPKILAAQSHSGHQCCCSPEKVAAHCCCCYSKKGTDSATDATPPCCRKTAALEQHKDGAGDPDRSTPAFSAIPCGCDPNYSPVAAENLKFLRPCVLFIASVSTLTGQYLSQQQSFLTRYTDPPDPPPRLSLNS